VVLEVVAALVVDLSEQRLLAFDPAGDLIYAALVSTGRAETPTPTGSFLVDRKYEETSMVGRGYRVPLVRNVMCLAGGGLAPDQVCVHPAPWQESAQERFGVPRSHGCIRTSSATARWLFSRTPLGTPVTVRP
jgi:lipoprotein-anchoring transpeptidase ErfK/SrfK